MNNQVPSAGNTQWPALSSIFLNRLPLLLQFLYLDDRDPRLEPRGQLREHLPEQLLVLQDLPHLHDPHNRCLQNRAGITSLSLSN